MNPILLFAALCAIVYLGFTARPVSWRRTGIKTLSVALLALVAGLEQAPVLLVAALALCALGDWFLSRGSEPLFKAGIGAFALGHLGYAVLFMRHPAADLTWLTGAPQAWIAIAVTGAIMAGAAFLLRGAGALKYPVLAYIPVLLGMAYVAAGLPDHGRLALVLPAAIAFVLSDLVLGIEAFVLPPDHAALRVTPYVIWPLYWGAQAAFLIAFI